MITYESLSIEISKKGLLKLIEDGVDPVNHYKALVEREITELLKQPSDINLQKIHNV